MAERWLPAEDRFALWEPVGDQLRVVGWRPGPAGVSVVDLAGGLRVVVDHATPSTLTELVVDLDDRRLPDRLVPLLAALLGEEATDVIHTLPSRQVEDRPTPLRDRRRDRADHPDDTFTRLALGADLGDDAELTATARAIALLEAALAGAEIHRPFGLELARRGLGELPVADPALDGKSGYQVSSLVRTVAAALDDPGLTDLSHRTADAMERARPPRTAAAAPASFPATFGGAAGEVRAAAMLPPAATAASRTASDAASGARSIEVSGDHRAWAWLDPGHHVEVTAGPSAAGTWARVFRRHDRLLLGLAPLRPGGRRHAERQLQALVVIPPNDPHDLVVDVVADPGGVPVPPVRDLVGRAVVAGRWAAHLRRIGDPAAAAAWADCAAEWDRLGDTQRANLARRHGAPGGDRLGSGRSRSPQGPALLADHFRS